MTWKDKVSEFGAGNVTFLSSDGATILFVVAADPVLLKGTFKNKPQERIGCPVVTDEGFFLFVTGKRTFRKISQFEDKFGTHALIVTRHGVEGDMDSKYEVALIDDKAKVKTLKEIVKKEFTPELLSQAITDAEEIMKG